MECKYVCSLAITENTWSSVYRGITANGLHLLVNKEPIRANLHSPHTIYMYSIYLQMALQRCNSPPEIVHIVDGGLFTNSPDIYYAIGWQYTFFVIKHSVMQSGWCL